MRAGRQARSNSSGCSDAQTWKRQHGAGAVDLSVVERCAAAHSGMNQSVPQALAAPPARVERGALAAIVMTDQLEAGMVRQIYCLARKIQDNFYEYFLVQYEIRLESTRMIKGKSPCILHENVAFSSVSRGNKFCHVLSIKGNQADINKH